MEMVWLYANVVWNKALRAHSRQATDVCTDDTGSQDAKPLRHNSGRGALNKDLFVGDDDTTYCGVIVCQGNLSQLHQNHALRLTWPHPSCTVRLASTSIALRTTTAQRRLFFGVLKAVCRQLTEFLGWQINRKQGNEKIFRNNCIHQMGLDATIPVFKRYKTLNKSTDEYSDRSICVPYYVLETTDE